MAPDEVKEIKVQIAVLNQKVCDWMGSTTEYRSNLCNKLDGMTKKLDGLQCPVHMERISTLQKDLTSLRIGTRNGFTWVWGCLGAVALCVLGSLVTYFFTLLSPR